MGAAPCNETAPPPAPLEPSEPRSAGLSQPGLGRGSGLGEQPGDRVAPLDHAGLVVAVQPELLVEVVHHREIRSHLLGKLSEMASPEVAHAGLELIETLAGPGELHFEEFCRARGLALAH